MIDLNDLFDFDEEDDEDFDPNVVAHIGVIRRSGRYPYGSGDHPHQRNQSFLDFVDDLAKKGQTQKQIAEGMKMTTTELRAAKSIAKAEVKADLISRAREMKDVRQMSNVAIGKDLNLNESSVRALLSEAAQTKNEAVFGTRDMLRAEVDKKTYLDIGAGTEYHMGVSRNKLDTAAAMLKDEGYRIDTVKIPQLGTNKETTVKVLSPPGTEYAELIKNVDKIRSVANWSEDGGRSFLGIQDPTPVNPKRVAVRYAEEGGKDKDGVIELRRGVDDISLGGANYAQVRIQVGPGHYLKGMAMYSDDMPPGVDLMFNTNKSNTGNKLDAMKPLKTIKENGKDTGVVDKDNPFGSIIRQREYTDSKTGKKKLSPLNIVGTDDPDGNRRPGEEGAWGQWSKNLSSQMLSKQNPALAKQQLDAAYKQRKDEYDTIMSLTNPAVRKTLLDSFADGADSASVKLSAAGLPGTRNHVILPIPSMKPTEIYAPNYNNGERVVLVRHPHGGIFEIPELVVNNNNVAAKRTLGKALDAVGINPKVAERLSGADFDGDTVLVIPNKQSGPSRVKTRPPLEELEGFDPQSYKVPKGSPIPKMTPRAKQKQMGVVSNLITDMTIKQAPWPEIARAVKHSMVVIDAEKHHLDWKQSAKDNRITELKNKYQKTATGSGAATLISRAKSEVRGETDRKPRSAGKGGPIDKETGKRVWEDVDRSYINKQGQKVTPVWKSTKMAETDDAFSLSSGTPMESIYAAHANRLKSLANQARLDADRTPNIKYNESAARTYAPEVKNLKAKLKVALRNAPLERQAQIYANANVKAKRQATPDMEKEELKKLKGMALTEARIRTGARKTRIEFTPREWEAVQNGAVSNNMLVNILKNTDLDKVKDLAMPRKNTVMDDSKLARARVMLAGNATQAEVAAALGVPVSTLMSAMG